MAFSMIELSKRESITKRDEKEKPSPLLLALRSVNSKPFSQVDEAPALASYSLVPVVKAFAKVSEEIQGGRGCSEVFGEKGRGFVWEAIDDVGIRPRRSS